MKGNKNLSFNTTFILSLFKKMIYIQQVLFNVLKNKFEEKT